MTIQLIFQPAIDIEPGDSTNTINLKRDASVPVAILSTANFNATTQVDVNSLRFGKTGSEASLLVDKKGRPQVSFQDVNGDGRLDLVASFVTSATNLQVTDTQAILTGMLVSGPGFQSSGPVQVVNQVHAANVASQAATQPANTIGSTSLSTMAVVSSGPTIDQITATPLFVDVSDDPRRKLR